MDPVRSRLQPHRVAAAGLLLAAAGCGEVQWRNADLQLDVSGGVDDEERVRVCVRGVGVHEEAAGSGRIAFDGLPEEPALVVTVDVLAEGGDTGGGGAVRRARAGPVALGAAARYSVATLEPCAGNACAACQADGPGPSKEAPWLLAVRFTP